MKPAQLIKCSVCGHNVSDQAPACPGCGDATAERVASERARASSALSAATTSTPPVAPAQAASNATFGVVAVGVFLLVVGLVGLLAFVEPQPPAPARPTPVVEQPSAPSGPSEADLNRWLEEARNTEFPARRRESAAKMWLEANPQSELRGEVTSLLDEINRQLQLEEIAERWDYSQSTDPMTGKKAHHATIGSDTVLNFDFPYQGPQRASLTLRRHPTYGNDVIFSIERGQILCSTYDCPIRVRFDEHRATTYEGNEPADNSTETVFIPAYATFLKQFSAAEKVAIQFNAHDEGSPVVTFDLRGFDPDRFK